MLSVAVIGCGYWGPNLVRNLSGVRGCVVKTVCDVDENRMAHMKELYPNVTLTSNYEDVVGDSVIDAVVIATPVRLHFEMARSSLEAGKHTFIEKPMASSVAECQELNRLAEDNGLTLMVGHTFIYSAPIQKIKEIVDSGELGDILYVSSRRLNLGLFQKDINVAWDLAPHDLSILFHVLGEEPLSVNCFGCSHIREKIEDITSMGIHFPNNLTAMLQTSWLDPIKVREMTFVGSRSMLVYDDLRASEKIRIYDKRVEAPPYYDTFSDFQFAYHHGDMRALALNEVEPLKVECQHFVECIQTGTTPRTSGRDGQLVVQVLEAASASLRRDGARVTVS